MRIGYWMLAVVMQISTLFLSACPGGGSGAGSISYSGATTQAALTDANANVLFSVVWNGGSSSGSSALAPQLAPAASENASVRGIVPLIKRTVEHWSGDLAAHSRAPKIINRATAINETNYGIVSGTETITGSIDPNTGIGTLTMTYVNFNDNDGETYDGAVILKVDGYDMANDVITDMTMSFTSWTIKSPASDISLAGSMKMQASLQNNSETLTVNMDSRDNTSADTFRFVNFIITSQYDSLLNPATLSETCNGRVYASAHGYVDVGTDAPLLYANFQQDTPNGGGPIVLSGAGNSRARITPLSTSHVKVEVDANGDGAYEASHAYAWNNLTGSPVELAPVALAGPDQTVLMGSTVTLSGSAIDDAVTGNLSFLWSLVQKPAGSAAVLSSLTSSNPTFTADLAGVYMASLVVSDGTVTSAADSVSVTAHREVNMLDFRIIDAEYSKQLDKVIMVSSSPSNQLHLYDPWTGLDTAVDLGYAPTSVSVGPDGLYAAVGHNNWISYVNLSTAALVKTLATTADVLDVVLAGNGYVYAFPKTDQWETIRCINVSTGAETQHTGASIYAGTKAKLQPGGTAIYGADNGLSPSDIEKYDISGGTASYLYDSPYHGAYAMCGDLWMSEDGLKIFTRCGNVFLASSNQADDMTYVGALQGLTLARHMSHSATNGKIIALPENATEALVFNDSSLTSEGAVALPQTLVNGSYYSGSGRYVFFNNAGDKYAVVLQVDAASGLSNDYGVVVY